MAEKLSADVFISYARADLDRVAPIVRELRAAGFEVWWDQMLEPGTSWEAEIDRRLEAAKAVVVVWSENSVDRFGTVCNEARYAERSGKLCTLNIDPVSPPTFFAHLHSENLTAWGEKRDHPRFLNVLARVTKLARSGDDRADPALLELGERLTRVENFTWGYSRRVNGFLDWLERRVDGGHPPGRGLWLRSFTPGLLNLTLLLAVAYPIFSLALQWAATGEEGRIGAFVAFEARPDFWWERATILLSVLVVLANRWLPNGSTITNFVYEVCLGGLMIGLTLVAFRDVASPLFYAFIPAVFAFGLGATMGRYLFGLALIMAAISLGHPVVIAIVAIALVTHFASTLVWPRLGRADFILFVTLVLMIFFFIKGAPFLNWRGIERLDLNQASLILFLAILPLINALFDFCSIGLTRYLLRKGAKEVSWRTLDYAALDLLLGALLFLALGCASIAAIHFLRMADGQPLLNLAEIFTDIAQRPQAYWWLYATYFSTLLPTICHVVIVGAAFADIFVGRVAEGTKRALLVAQPEALDGAIRGLVIRSWIARTVGLALGAAFSVGLIYLIAFGGGSMVASAMFDLFILFAQLIGAIPWDWTRPT